MTEAVDLLDQRARDEFARQPLNRSMGLALDALTPGFARVVMTTSDWTQGGIKGSVHGGLLAALADIVALRAVFTTIRSNEEPAGTADLAITYLRPALGRTITAEATVLRKGRQLAVIEVAMSDDEGRLCSKSRVLYAVRPRDR